MSNLKATGVIRRIDDLGRIVIPKEFRHRIGLREGDAMEIYLGSEGEVTFKKYDPKDDIVELLERVSDAFDAGNYDEDTRKFISKRIFEINGEVRKALKKSKY